MDFASDVAFTPSVKRVQSERGSRRSYARMEQQQGGFAVAVDAWLAAYIALRDSAYLATANALGQPYVQHRGGPPGFIRVIDEHTLAFADFSGNKQYISTGNLADNDRAFLFLMNYEQRERIKIWGRARIVKDDPALLARLADPSYKARVEQAIVLRVTAWDINCPQHIPHLVHADAVAERVGQYKAHIARLEAALLSAGVEIPVFEELA